MEIELLSRELTKIRYCFLFLLLFCELGLYCGFWRTIIKVFFLLLFLWLLLIFMLVLLVQLKILRRSLKGFLPFVIDRFSFCLFLFWILTPLYLKIKGLPGPTHHPFCFINPHFLLYLECFRNLLRLGILFLNDRWLVGLLFCTLGMLSCWVLGQALSSDTHINLVLTGLMG
jgi:hypothetical protein